MPLNGALVHYVVPDGPELTHGQCRPALVVQDWGVTAEGFSHLLNLVVFRDGENDRRVSAPPGSGHPAQHSDSLLEWRTSVNHSHQHEFSSWHTLDECAHR